MADFRRFYNHGLEHTLHLEELDRSALEIKNAPVGSRQKLSVVRRWLALTLTTLAERIDPTDVPHGNKATDAVS